MKLASIRGMNDILPDETPVWQWLEERTRSVLQAYGYREIRLPIVESTDLFKRSIGEVTDIVEKEMYTFADRNGDSLTLRPEGTAGCVRAGEQHNLFYGATPRLWYTGPMFRHERPQAGRYRQFHQIGVEAFGMEGPDIDAEIILLTAALWRALGLEDEVTLELNSLGDADDRQRHREALVAYLAEHREQLDVDSQRRLESNPLRILDSKDASTQKVLEDAPQLSDYLGEQACAHFAELRGLLDAAGIEYRINTSLVRGLDYYGKTVFEWVTDALGAQGTVCAGGRYDGLVRQLGGRDTPAVGFAMGLERLVWLLRRAGGERQPVPDVYIVAPGQTARALTLADELREGLPGSRVLCHCGGGSFKSQLKKADKSGAPFALILGEAELDRGEAMVKPMRGGGEQQSVPLHDLPTRLAQWLRLQDETA